MKCLPNEMRSLFHRGEAYFIGAKPISPGRNLWINAAPSGHCIENQYTVPLFMD
jgi:hypothetical protein